MSFDPRFSGLDDVDCEFHRRMIDNAAANAREFADMICRLINMRQDHRAQAMRESLAEEMVKINNGFHELAKALRAVPHKMAVKHRVNGYEPPIEDHPHPADEAEANAAAGR